MDILVPTEDGYWVNENHARISELIREYNPDMELVWIPPDRRFDDAIPYAVRHNPPNAMPYIVFHIKEDELDHRVLGRLYAGDTTKHDVLARIEADDQARLNLQTKINIHLDIMERFIQNDCVRCNYQSSSRIWG